MQDSAGGGWPAPRDTIAEGPRVNIPCNIFSSVPCKLRRFEHLQKSQNLSWAQNPDECMLLSCLTLCTETTEVILLTHAKWADTDTTETTSGRFNQSINRNMTKCWNQIFARPISDIPLLLQSSCSLFSLLLQQSFEPRRSLPDSG